MLSIKSCLWIILSSIITPYAIAEVSPAVFYKINSGDLLEVSVWKEDSLQRELHVLPDGTISFPLAGVISVAGKSIKEIQTEITKKLAEYITEPVVNITVKAVEGNVVYILGQVKSPGHFVMSQPMDVMQALSLAGGLTTFAKANNILILRRNKNTAEAIKFEYGDLESGNHLERNYLLKSGDVIVVP
jgi:polysaccharide export outer membrane protein